MRSKFIAIVGVLALGAGQCVLSSPTTGFDWSQPLKSMGKLDFSSCQKMINDFLPGGSKFNGQLQTLSADLSSVVEKCIRIISDQAKQLGNVTKTVSSVRDIASESIDDDGPSGIRVHQAGTESQKDTASGQQQGSAIENQGSSEQQSGFGKFSRSVRAPLLHESENVPETKSADLTRHNTTTAAPQKAGPMGFDFQHLHIEDKANYTKEDQLNNEQPENFYDDEEQQQLGDQIDQQQLNMIPRNKTSEQGQEEEEEGEEDDEEEVNTPTELNQFNSSSTSSN